MTTKEAIEFLRNMIDREAIGFVCPEREGDVAIWQYHIEALQMAISALEKQIPKKTKQFEMGLDGKIIIPCGNCESTLDGDWDYCPYCGQNILWRVKGDNTGSGSEKVK